MKFMIFILVVLLSSISLYAQEEVVAGELSIWVKNNPQNKQISMTLELVSPVCWDQDHYITELYNGGTESSNVNGGWIEFHVCWSSNPLFYYKTFGLGLYKVTAKVNNINKVHFFIDYRTSDLPGAIGPGCSIDYALDFDVSAEKFYYRLTQNEFSDYHAFWDLRPCVELITYGLEDYWENALVMINTGNNKPRIVWGPYDDDNYATSGYYVYSATNYSFTPPPLNQFSLVATLNNTTYNWTDNSYVIGGVLKAHYYVKAIITPVEGGASTTSSPTNIVTSTVSSIGGGIGHKDKIENPELITFYSLSQNYPNPFNPSTVINYQTPDDNFVTLEVFDVLGREVAELVNTYKEAGTHSVEFNASELPSGIYFYKIQIGNYSETRKLILQR